jgi:hypothetical protein
MNGVVSASPSHAVRLELLQESGQINSPDFSGVLE